MKQGYLLTSLASMMLASCGDSPTLSNTPPNNNPTPGPVEADYYVSPASTECHMEIPGEQGRGLDNILGSGYDITGSYLSTTALRGKVIDLAKLPADALTVLSAPAYNSGEMFMGSNSTAFLKDLMANVGMEYTPSNPNICFTETLVSPSANATTLMHITWQRKLSGNILSTSSVISRALSDDFARDVKFMRAQALVERYGTHFLVHANVGLAVRTVYSAYVDTPDEDKTVKANEGLRAAEAALVGKLGPDLTLTLSGLRNYGASLIKTFCGGDPNLVEYDPVAGILGDYSLWQESGDRSNFSLIDLSDGDLLPLSAAIDDPSLKKEVDEAIRQYITESQNTDNTTAPLLQNTNGKLYRYVTNYEESLRLENEEGLKSYGILGSLYCTQVDNAIPIYTNIDPNGNQILSLIQPTDEWIRIGYVMPSRSHNTVSLYEISDGLRFAYTIEAANSYGPLNEWHPTGAVFHLLRP